MIDDQDIEHSSRQSGLKAEIAQQQAAAGANRGMFEDDSVAGHQIGRENADRLVKGKIPGLDAVDHADRRIGYDPAFFAAAMNARFIGEFRGTVLGGIVEDLRAKLHFHLAVPQQFARFPGHEIGDDIRICPQLCGDGSQVWRAHVMAFAAPFLEGVMGCSEYRESDVFAHQRVGRNWLIGRRINGDDMRHNK